MRWQLHGAPRGSAEIFGSRSRSLRERRRGGEEGAQKKTGATAPAFVRMMFCEDEDGLGFAGCENETGVAVQVVVVADIIVVVRGGRSGD